MQTPAISSSDLNTVRSYSPPRPKLVSGGNSEKGNGEKGNLEELLKISEAFQMVLPNLVELARELERVQSRLQGVEDRYSLLTQRVVRTDARSLETEAKVEKLKEEQELSALLQKIELMHEKVEAAIARLSQLNP